MAYVSPNVTAIRENGATTGVGVLGTYAYDNLGRRTTLTRGNGAVTSFAFDPVSRLSSLTQNPTGTANDITLDFTYNPASQIATATRSTDVYAWGGHYNVNRAYGTNGLNQLTTAGATALSYDLRGNLTTSGASAYSYTSENLLITGPASASLSYDPAMRLYQTVGAGVTTRFGYDGTDLIAEYNASNTLLRRYVHGPGTDEPLVWYEGTTLTDRRFLHADERGSVIAISDGTGAVTTINKYDEYGIPAATNAGRFQYTGQTWLPELGMYYYKARIYSPTLGRFMQTDPIGYGDGLNWYGYVGGDPVNGRDPSGLSRGDDDYWRGWSQWQRQSYCDQVSAQNCAVIDPLLEVGGRIYHLNLANSDPETKKAATDVFKLWACNPESGTLYDSSRAAMLGGARRAESDRRAGRDRLERAFPVNSILGFRLLGGIRFYTFGNITVGSEDDVRQVGGDAGSYHSHIPDKGRGLSDADMVNAKTFFRGRSASFIVGLGFPSGRIAAYVETSRLGGSGETLGFVCK